MNYLVIEHLSGSKAKQVEEFPVTLYPELLVGRDLAANVRFTDAEALVGRQHVKITQAGKDPPEFRLTDLNSRNGTFVNGIRIAGTSVLRSGDVIQLGPEGPQLRFELRPSTESLVADPREAEAVPSPTLDEGKPANFPLAHLPSPAPPSHEAPEPARADAPNPPVSQPVDVQPVAPAVAKSHTELILGGVAVVVAILLAASYFGYRRFAATGSEATTLPAASPAEDLSPTATATPGSVEGAVAEKEAQPSPPVPDETSTPLPSPSPSPSVVVKAAAKPVAKPKPPPAKKAVAKKPVAKPKPTPTPADKKKSEPTESGKKKKKKKQQA